MRCLGNAIGLWVAVLLVGGALVFIGAIGDAFVNSDVFGVLAVLFVIGVVLKLFGKGK